MKKQKENSLENITWSEMGKQNVQAKEVYWGHCKLKLIMNANQVKCWFLRRRETRVRGENFSM